MKNIIQNHLFYENKNLFDLFLDFINKIDNENLIIQENNDLFFNFKEYHEINNKKNKLFKISNINDFNLFIVNQLNHIDKMILIIDHKSKFILNSSIILLLNMMRIKKIIFLIYLDEENLDNISFIKFKYNEYITNLIHEIKIESKIENINLNYKLIMFFDKILDENKFLNIETAKNLIDKEIKYKVNFEKDKFFIIKNILSKISKFVYEEDKNYELNKNDNNLQDFLFIIKNKYLIGNKGYSEIEFINNYIDIKKKFKILKDKPNLYSFPGLVNLENYELLINKNIEIDETKNISSISIIYKPELIYELKEYELLFFSNKTDLSKINNKNFEWIKNNDLYEITALIYILDDIDYNQINYIVKFNKDVIKIKKIILIKDHFKRIKVYKLLVDKFIYFDKNLQDHYEFLLENFRYNKIGRGFII